MAVERLTDYTRRIWTALDADAPEDHDIQVNDVIYYMDSSQCGIVTQVYPGGSIDVEFLPDVGGGSGGSEGTMDLLNSGTYTLASNLADNLVIPVSIDPGDTLHWIYLCYTGTASANKTIAGMITYSLQDIMPELGTLNRVSCMQYTDNNAVIKNSMYTQGGYSPMWVDNASAPTAMTLQRYLISSNVFPAGDYVWAIRGEKA